MKTQKSTTIVGILAILGLVTALTVMGCDDGSSTESAGSITITWTLSQSGGVPGTGGNAPTATTTDIVITFSASVSGLTASDIIVSDGWNGSTMNGSGKTWTLPLTITESENISVTITKDGIEAGSKNVMVYKEGDHPPETSVGVDPVGGKTTYIEDYFATKFEFNATAKTYTISASKRDADKEYVLDASGKYQWEVDEIGTYTWNTTTQIITLEVKELRQWVYDDNEGYIPGELLNKSQYREVEKALINEEIEDSMEWSGMNRAQAILEYIGWYAEEFGFTTLDEVIDYEVNCAFADHQYLYSLSTDGSALFLHTEKLAPIAAEKDELKGKTYQGSGTYQFGTDGTYTYTADDGSTSTGSYAYDKLLLDGRGGQWGSGGQGNMLPEVYFKPATIEGKTPMAYYETVEVPSDNPYPDAAAYRAAATTSAFAIYSFRYDPVEMTIK